MKKQTNKIKLLFLVSLIFVCSSCNQTYKSLFKENTDNYSLLKKDISDKLKKWNSNNPESNTADFELFINPIVINKKNIGIYNYGVVGSHHSRKNIFAYDNDGIHFINTEDIENANKEVQSFLSEHKFTMEEKKECLEKINKLMTDKNTDSF